MVITPTTSNYRTIHAGDGNAKVFDLKVDKDDIVVSLENGDIEVYDRDSLARRHLVTGHFRHGVHVGLHPKYFVTGFFEKVVDVWSRQRRCNNDDDDDVDVGVDVDDKQDDNYDDDGIKRIQRIELESSVYVVKVSEPFIISLSLFSGGFNSQP